MTPFALAHMVPAFAPQASQSRFSASARLSLSLITTSLTVTILSSIQRVKDSWDIFSTALPANAADCVFYVEFR
jgi:hypothetical protein